MTPLLNPFPGLRPFRESEAHLFFGRSAHVDELLAELARSRFVAVMGASASGKSSLVNAGVLPALHGGFVPRVGSHWRIASFRPGVSPIHNLARALAGAEVLGADDGDPVIAVAQVEATLRRSAFGLADAVRQSPELGDGRVLVVVDQFEELFRFQEPATDPGLDEDAEPFVQLLIEAARDDDAPVDVILTMRSDFLGDCSRFRDLPESINRGLYLVPRLTRSQLQEAITAPAAVGGATLSPRLVQRLLNDAGADPDMLPVVQHAMMRTWEIWATNGADAGPIDIEHYEACGGLSDALSRHADEAYFELEGTRRRAITELMFKRITELGDDHREVRRPTPLAEIAAVADAPPATVEACIGHFEEQGRSFVTVSADGVVDISHESLIRQWPRLKSWVREEAESREVYRRLADAADRWRRGEAALLRDPDLQIASKWWEDTRPNQAWADRYNPAFEPAARYLDQSRKAARRRRVGAVAGITTLAVLALVAGLLAVSANHQRNQADRQRRTATARQLAASSTEAGAASRSVGILAALQAIRATERDGFRLPVADEALRQAMTDREGVMLASGPANLAGTEPARTAFSPDGSVLASGGSDGRVRMWSPAAPEAKPRVLPGDGPAITALAMSGDGRWLAAGGEGGTARLWDLTAPDAEPQPLPGHRTDITALAFSPDGKRLATSSLDNTALLWNVGDTRAAQPLPRHSTFVNSLAFSPDGSKIATVGGDGVALVSEVANPTADPLTLSGHDNGIVAVAFSPDGRWVATGGEDNTARLWDLTRPHDSLSLKHDGQVDAVAFSGDGRWLATGSEDQAVRLWDLQDPAGPKAHPIVLPHDDAVEALAFSGARPEKGDSSRWLATGSRDSTARLYEIEDLLARPIVLAGHEGPVDSVVFGDADRWLATGSGDGTARLWDLEHPSVRPAVLEHGPQSDVGALAFSPDGRRLATGASDKKVRLWDVTDTAADPRVLDHEAVPGFAQAGIAAVAFSPDGRLLATGSGDRRVRIWTLDDPAPDPEELPSFDDAVNALAFSPDGRWLATAVKAKVAFMTDMRDPARRRHPLTGHDDEITSVAFDPGGQRLATGSRDGTVRLWAPGDLSADAEELTIGERVTSVAFRPDGRQLAVGLKSTVQLWDVGERQPRLVRELHAGGPVASVAYSPDGQTLIASAGTSVTLWNLGVPDRATSIANPVVLRGHSDTVTAVDYSPDGRHFASASSDGTALVWLSLDALVDASCRSVGRNLTQDEWRGLLPGEDYQRTCEEWPSGP